MQKPEFIQENVMYKILMVVEIQTDQHTNSQR